jgi:hypothetical protein
MHRRGSRVAVGHASSHGRPHSAIFAAAFGFARIFSSTRHRKSASRRIALDSSKDFRHSGRCVVPDALQDSRTCRASGDAQKPFFLFNFREIAMKKLFLASAVLSAVLANAAQAQSPESVEVLASKFSPLDAKQAYWDFKGTYDMSDGSLLSLRKVGYRYYAVIDANAPAEIKFVGDNRFVTATGRTEFQFGTDQRSLGAMVTLTKENGTVLASSGTAPRASF